MTILKSPLGISHKVGVFFPAFGTKIGYLGNPNTGNVGDAIQQNFIEKLNLVRGDIVGITKFFKYIYTPGDKNYSLAECDVMISKFQDINTVRKYWTGFKNPNISETNILDESLMRIAEAEMENKLAIFNWKRNIEKSMTY